MVGGNAWRTRGRLGQAGRPSLRQRRPRSLEEVESVTSVVTLKRPSAELRLNRGDDRWAKLVGKLPGS